MYGRIIDGQLQAPPPHVGRLNDGRWVSNYNLLPVDVLELDGWKPIAEIKPDYNPATQHLEAGEFVDSGDGITLTYVVVTNDDPLADLEGLL